MSLNGTRAKASETVALGRQSLVSPPPPMRECNTPAGALTCPANKGIAYCRRIRFGSSTPIRMLSYNSRAFLQAQADLPPPPAPTATSDVGTSSPPPPRRPPRPSTLDLDSFPLISLSTPSHTDVLKVWRERREINPSDSGGSNAPSRNGTDSEPGGAADSKARDGVSPSLEDLRGLSLLRVLLRTGRVGRIGVAGSVSSKLSSVAGLNK
jgi:hypothetical protein